MEKQEDRLTNRQNMVKELVTISHLPIPNTLFFQTSS